MTARSKPRLTFWPTSEQEHLLRASLLGTDAALASFDAWQRAVDFETLDAGSFRLLPLLYQQLLAMGVESPLMARLKGVHRQSWFKNQLLFKRIAETIAALSAAGIETMVLKGVPLAILDYKNEAVRPMADGDILVKPDDVRVTVDVLRRCGWQPHQEPPHWPFEPRCSWAFFGEGDHELDLHWRVYAESFSPDRDLWAASVPLDLRGAPTRTLAPADRLLHVLVHGLQWSPVPSIRWIADATTTIRRAGESLDWDRLLASARSRRLEAVLQTGLSYLQRTLDVAVPDHVAAWISARTPTRGERLELWARFQPGVTGGACRLWFEYRRFAIDRGGAIGPIGFSRYLSDYWSIGSPWRLPKAMAQRVARRIERQWRREPHIT